MPDITTFDAGNLRLQPSQSGIEANVRSAYRIGAFGRQQAQAYDQAGRAIGGGVAAAGEAALQFEDHREISAGMAAGSKMLLDKEQQWNDIAKTSNPNDPTVRQKFLDDELEPALQDFESGFHTQASQRWAQEYTDHIRGHMATKTGADQSTLADIAAHDNTLSTANTLATAAYSDPSSIGMAFDTLDHSLGAMVDSSPTISAVDAARVKETFGTEAKKQIVSAAVHGVIAKGGDWHAIAVDPKYAPYVNAPEIQQFERTEKFYRRGAEVEAKQKMLLDKEIATQNMHAAVNDSWTKNVSIDPTGRVTIGPGFVRDMVNLPTAHHNAPDAASTAKTYIDWAESQQKPAPARDDPAAVDALLKTVADPGMPLDQAKVAVIRADIGKQITTQTRTQIIQLATDMRNLNDPLLSRDMEAAKEIIEPKFGGVNANPGGYARFYYDFIHNQYMPAKVAGRLPPDALDLGNPKSMISQAVTKATGGAQVAVPAAVHANGGVGAAPLPVYTAPAGDAAKPPTVTDKAAYDKLPPGAAFVDQSGKLWTKPTANIPTLQPGQM